MVMHLCLKPKNKTQEMTEIWGSPQQAGESVTQRALMESVGMCSLLLNPESSTGCKRLKKKHLRVVLKESDEHNVTLRVVTRRGERWVILPSQDVRTPRPAHLTHLPGRAQRPEGITPFRQHCVRNI